MKKLRDELDWECSAFLLRFKCVHIDIFKYRDGETPYLIAYGQYFDTNLCTEQQAKDSVDFIDFLGWTIDDVVIGI